MGLTTGEMLQNRYRVVSLMGQGGMGAIYRAWDMRLKMHVALKEMIPQPGLDATMLAQLRQQFEQEAAVLARLNHPHLVRVIDFFEEKSNTYLVMDFVEGESLADRIAREGALPEAQTLTWANQLLDALAYCHDQGVLHRDVKPQNVIIRPDGQAVLVDFGLVKLWDPNDPRTKTAMRGMGTPEYAPPEQYDATAGHTTPASDIYSLGATLYHALTGLAPPTATLRMADPTQFTPLRELAPHVTSETEAVIMKAMELVCVQRWEGAQEMAAALRGKAPTPAPVFVSPVVAKAPAAPVRQATKVIEDAHPAAVAAPKAISRRRFLRRALIIGGSVGGCGAVAAVAALAAQGGGWLPFLQPPTEVPQPGSRPTKPTGRIPIRWFIGLGVGTDEDQRQVEEEWVASFNARQDEIDLTVEIANSDEAQTTLMAQIAAGTPPDIVGPVGVGGSSRFYDLWLGLGEYLPGPYREYDMGDLSPSTMDVWRIPGRGLIGLPVNAYPSALYINRDLFDKVGVTYPPQGYAGGGRWTIEAIEEAAKALTIDTHGRDAASDRFDPGNVAQFGYVHQWTDPRGWATFFGAGSFVAEDGRTARCPDHWREALKWYYRGMWGDTFAPNGPYVNGELLGGNPFNSGRVAIAHCHIWYTCCVTDVSNWGYAIVPAYNKTHTAKLHTDMIGILNTCAHPDIAVKAAYAIATNPELIETWIGTGGLPAFQSLLKDSLARLDEQFPHGVNWDTILAGLEHVDVPNHESWMPNFSQADERVKAFQTLVENDGGLDVDAEINTLVADLQAIFDAA
jgi:multiple sugar transport system substrate-binding protein